MLEPNVVDIEYGECFVYIVSGFFQAHDQPAWYRHD